MKTKTFRTLRFAAVAWGMAAALPAFADCHWEWLCNGEGTCKQLPVCDTLYENPPPRPDDKPPVPPISMRPYRMPPDIGGATCEYVLRQVKPGKWEWDRACYCSDPAKSKDPDAPLSNIVRCTPPYKE